LRKFVLELNTDLFGTTFFGGVLRGVTFCGAGFAGVAAGMTSAGGDNAAVGAGLTLGSAT
jgi:hypothetical protein